MERIHDTFEKSSRKSTRRGGRQFEISQTTAWRVFRRRLHMKPCKLSLVQALTTDNKVMGKTFCESVLEMVEDDETLLSCLVCSDETTFHLSGKVIRHNVCIWGTHHLHEAVKHQKDFPKMNVFWAVSQDKIYNPFF